MKKNVDNGTKKKNQGENRDFPLLGSVDVCKDTRPEGVLKDLTWTLISLRVYFETMVKHVVHPKYPLGRSDSSISAYTGQTMGLLISESLFYFFGGEVERERSSFLSPLCELKLSGTGSSCCFRCLVSVTQESNRIYLYIWVTEKAVIQVMWKCSAIEENLL